MGFKVDVSLKGLALERALEYAVKEGFTQGRAMEAGEDEPRGIAFDLGVDAKDGLVTARVIDSGEFLCINCLVRPGDKFATGSDTVTPEMARSYLVAQQE